ncbi:alpha/beta fold hydrolase [Streptomyces pseudogriseolus]|uniref:alpha/beta fold hydrolase n=1 Tax=Streptomyces pseudogriseolus TaxID=36817 RepID=UPI003FA28C01
MGNAKNGRRASAGLVCTDHVLSVPWDHEDPGGEQIEVYAREVVLSERAAESMPWLLYLQGGPGMSAQRPLGHESWLLRALEDYRVLLLDQRGTGRSSPVNRQSLPRRGDARAQALYLRKFRADSIVKDAECIRRRLLGERETWSVLGQSFGGFCALTYLSYAPEGLREVVIAGGLPGLSAHPRDVYRAAFRRAAARNARFYDCYPQHVRTVADIVGRLRDHDVRLLDGSPLTVARFQSLGRLLGMTTGMLTLHYLLEDPFIQGVSGRVLSDGFLAEVEAHLSFASHPLYALLHEPSYGQSSVSPHAVDWAAQRVRDEFPEFDAEAALLADSPVYLTGEMIFPWMFETDPALRDTAEVARLLARHEGWPDLYDPRQLSRNQVPVAAAVYSDDMYVDRQDSLETARRVRGLKVWETDAYEHDALRHSGHLILDRLLHTVRKA